MQFGSEEVTTAFCVEALSRHYAAGLERSDAIGERTS